MEKQQQKDELNSELKEENIMLQRKLQDRLVKKVKENTCITDFSINLLVVNLVHNRESVNLIGYITCRLSADSLRQDSCSRDCIRDPLSNLNQYTWRATFEPDET